MNWSQYDYNLILGTYSTYNNINIIFKVTNQCFKQTEQKDNHIIVILCTWLVDIFFVLFKHKFFEYYSFLSLLVNSFCFKLNQSIFS